MKDMGTKGNLPRVLLVSGIFFPDVGGPATHVRKIAEHFAALGWTTTVVAFGEPHPTSESYRVIRVSRRLPKPISWLLYAWTIVREVFQHDVIYAFDLTTAGFPSAIMSQLTGKPFLLRIGGDPIWERVVEHGKRFLPMRAYYEQSLFRTDKPFLYEVIRYVVQSATRVVTYSEFLRSIYVTFYDVPAERIAIIRNPFPVRSTSSAEKDTVTFVFAGRFVSYKNLERVVRIFGRLSQEHSEARLLLVGEGPEEAALKGLAAPYGDRISMRPSLAQQELFAAMRGASVALAPALTEFNPNFILESLALGKPALISRDNGLSVELPGEFQFNPLDDDSLHDAMKRMLSSALYAEAVASVASLPLSGTWEEVVRFHEALVVASVRTST